MINTLVPCITILIQTVLILNISSYFAILNVNASEQHQQFFINSTFNKINGTILFFSQANTTLLKMWFIDLTAEDNIDSAPGDGTVSIMSSYPILSNFTNYITCILLLNEFEISCKYFHNPERVQNIEFKTGDVFQKISVNDYLKSQN